MDQEPNHSLRADEALQDIVKHISSTSGGEFYRRLAEGLGSVFGATYVGIGEVSGEDHVQLLGSWARRADAPSSYALRDTPAAGVLAGEVLQYVDNLRRDFPLDKGLDQMFGESYIGVPIIEAHGEAIGLIELVFDTPLEDATSLTAILLAMAERVVAEMERGQAEAALRDSEVRYRALVEDSFHLVAEIVGERIVYASAGYTEALGYEPEDVLGGSVFDLIHPDDRQEVAAELHSMLVERRSTNFLVRMRHRNDGWRWVESTGRAFRTSAGEYRTTLFSRDITQRLQSEETLRESEEQFRLLAEHSTDLIGRYSTEGECLWISPSALAITGYTAAELLGDGPSRLIHPDDLAGAISAVAALANGANSTTSTFRFQHKNGHYIWLEARGKPITDADGLVKEIQSTTRDVTARIAREAALSESEERFRLMAENASDIIVRFNPEGVCTWISPSVKDLGGWEPEDFIGTTPRRLIHPDDEAIAPMAPANLEELLATTNTVTTTFRFPRKDGAYLWMESKGRAIRDPEHGGVIEIQVAARDVTARKEAEEALRRSEQLFRATLESTVDGIIVNQPGGELLYWNTRAAELLQIPLEILEARDAAGFARHVVERAERPVDLAHAISRASRDVPEHVGTWGTKDGRLLEAFVHPLPDADGRWLRVWSIRDVTEKQRSEAALRQSEERFRSLAEHTSDMVLGIRGPGLIDYASPNCWTLLNRTPDELVGTNALDLVHHDDLPLIVAEFDQAAEAGAIASAVVRVRHADATWRWFEFTSNFFTAPSGELRAVVTARDITTRKEAEDALAESQERLRMVVNSAPLGLVAVDASGTMTLAEGQGLAMLGVDREQLIGKGIHTLFANYPELLSDIERALGGEDLVAVRQIRDSTFETHFRPQHNTDGAPSGIIAVAYDVSSRVQAESDLRESEETARALLNAPTDGAVLVDREGMILAMNATAERRFREHASAQHVATLDFIGTCVFDLFAPELREQRKARNDEVFANGVRRHFEDERNGIWTDVTVDPIHDSSGQVSRLAIFSRDITDRKRDEAALRKRSRELEALNDYLEKTSAELERSQNEAREVSEQLAQLLDAEQARSRTDTLTGALNHGAILEVAAEAIAADVGFAVAMVDVDGMKSVNDTYGHQAGDELLLAVTSAISRGGAIAGRYGGDEFLVALLDASRAEADEYKHAVEVALSEAQVIDPESGARVPVVASVGIAIFPEDASSLTALIERADEYMYEEKKQRGVGTGLSSSRTLGDERTARMVGELVPLLTSSGTLDEKLRLVSHRLSVGASYAGVSFDVFAEDITQAPGVNATMSQNAFTKAPDEVLEAWNRQQRAGTGITGVGELLRETRRPVVIDDIEHSDMVTDEQRRLLLSIGIVSGIVVPLFSADAMVATMSVGSKELAGFGQKDVQFLTAVAGQVAAIIRMARVVEHLRTATERLEESRDETVMLLASATEAHSRANNRHFHNVRAISELIALEMGFNEVDLRELGLAAALHDVGKIHLPDALLSSPERISPRAGMDRGMPDWEVLKEHCVNGRDFLDQTRGFELAARVAYTHHERWDGNGYPEGLAGDAIPLESAIIAVADSLDAMMTERAYQASRSLDDAVAEIEACSGTQFSPAVVVALLLLHGRGDLPHLWDQDNDAVAA